MGEHTYFLHMVLLGRKSYKLIKEGQKHMDTDLGSNIRASVPRERSRLLLRRPFERIEARSGITVGYGSSTRLFKA